MYKRQDADSARAFWIQMKVNKLQSDGGRLRDMPEEYFDLADSDEKGNPLIDGLKVFRFQRQIDEKDFDGARETGQRLLEDTACLLYTSRRRSDRFCSSHLSERYQSNPGANHIAGGGGLLRRREDGHQSAGRKKPGGRLPSAGPGLPGRETSRQFAGRCLAGRHGRSDQILSLIPISV